MDKEERGGVLAHSREPNEVSACNACRKMSDQEATLHFIKDFILHKKVTLIPRVLINLLACVRF
jgi:hypothetical protein